MKRLIILCIAIIAVLTVINGPKIASAEATEYYIICTPDGAVNVRKHAKIKSADIASLDFGKWVLTDGKDRNGFLHVIDLAAEDTSGWVSKGYLVKDQPIAGEWIGYAVGLGRIAARKQINGKIIKWLQPGSEVMIVAYSSEWCVTEYGFIRTEFIEIPQSED